MTRPGPVHHPPERPTAIYDGACGMCTRWAQRMQQKHGRGDLELVPVQNIGDRFEPLDRAALSGAMHLVEPTGEVYRGAEAMLRARWRLTGAGAMYWLYRRVPGAAAMMEWAYRRIANQRGRLSRWLGVPACTSDVCGIDPRDE